jgi:hypothetical protein
MLKMLIRNAFSSSLSEKKANDSLPPDQIERVKVFTRSFYARDYAIQSK